MANSTPARERIHIDRGLGRDKVAYPDPAAAPLGTDAEAGGHPHPDVASAVPTAVSDEGFRYDLPAGEEDNRARAVDQPGWNLWGFIVGSMAAGAAVLILLSFKTV